MRECIDTYVLLTFVGLQEVQHHALWLKEQEVPIVSCSANHIARGVEPIVDFLYWEKRRRDFGTNSRDN